jgi:hypothetical protein
LRAQGFDDHRSRAVVPDHGMLDEVMRGTIPITAVPASMRTAACSENKPRVGARQRNHLRGIMQSNSSPQWWHRFNT